MFSRYLTKGNKFATSCLLPFQIKLKNRRESLAVFEERYYLEELLKRTAFNV